MVKEMNPSEYESLRSEIIARIQMVTSLDNSVLIATGSLWVAVGAISGNLLFDQVSDKIILWIQLVLLIIAALLILIAAMKSWENVYQITSISAYIKVFYDYPSMHVSEADIEKGKMSMWETLQMQTNTWNLHEMKGVQSRIYRASFNGSYFLLEIATILIIGFVLKSYGIIDSHFFSNAFFIPVLLIIPVVIVLYRLTYVNNFLIKKQKKFLRAYAKAAIEYGVIDTSTINAKEGQSPVDMIVDEILREMKIEEKPTKE